MEWMSDVTAGDWIGQRVDWDPSIGTSSVVPRGFEAYARVFHPVYRERPVGVSWPAPADRAGWEAFIAREHQVDSERVTWQDASRAFGTTMHAEAQWNRIARAPALFDDDGSEIIDLRDGEGWRYDAPEEGRLDADALAAVAAHLAGHTTTPDAGYAAVWEGWGGLLGAKVSGGSSAVLRYVGDVEPRHRAMLGASYKDAFNNVFRRPRWEPGLLSDEISRGPRLELPGRGHVLFRAAPREWTDAGWVERAPWREETPVWTRSPSLIWPDDRAWVLVTEIDFDSTIVAGPSALIRALVADEGVEALPVREDVDLSWDADDLNRP